MIEQEMAGWMRRTYRRGLTTLSGGNLSVRAGDTVLITASGRDKARLRAADIVRIHLANGRPLEATAPPPSIETGMHLALYRAQPTLGAILHAHPPWLSVFCVTGRPVNTDLLTESRDIVGSCGVVPRAACGSPELAAAVVAAAAQGHNALVLAGHGALALGRDARQAYNRLEVLEQTAQAQLFASGNQP
ncbi:MAG: class II aldolase/adducin family protein, partial [Candidatus Marinimicrobia bacterium]|nr:class II aldolase/adducin family protein [Candidatus Neomarinimicrobiota bacterium]